MIIGVETLSGVLPEVNRAPFIAARVISGMKYDSGCEVGMGIVFWVTQAYKA